MIRENAASAKSILLQVTLFHCLPFLMYALKARDKLHKKEKDEYEARHHPKNPKRKSGANFKPAKDSPSVTVNREAKVMRSCS